MAVVDHNFHDFTFSLNHINNYFYDFLGKKTFSVFEILQYRVKFVIYAYNMLCEIISAYMWSYYIWIGILKFNNKNQFFFNIIQWTKLYIQQNAFINICIPYLRASFSRHDHTCNSLHLIFKWEEGTHI